MIRLSREVRTALVPPGQASQEARNSWAGWPASDRLVPRFRLQLEVEGTPDPKTGYLCNIQVIDRLLRDVWNDYQAERDVGQPAGMLLAELGAEVVRRWPQAVSDPQAQAAQPAPRIVALTLHLSPFLWLTRHWNADMSSPATTQLTYQFEFSAAHRLHCAEFSDDHNREVFGKCNNPHGHGHNYVVEVTVSGGDIDGSSGQVMPLPALESVVNRTVIDRLDHRHLNEDVEAFADVNPSVENIARVIFEWLQPELAPVQLDHVQVYETPKTWARYSGAGAN